MQFLSAFSFFQLSKELLHGLGGLMKKSATQIKYWKEICRTFLEFKLRLIRLSLRA